MTLIKNKVIYRVHITCTAGHTTYEDYKTKRYAVRRYNNMQDKTDWYAVGIERILL